MKSIKQLLALMALLLISASGHALSTDKDQPIMVEADSMEVDNKNGITIYQGNVELTQGSIHMVADKVTITQKNKKTEKIISEGNPVKFRQRPDGKQEDIKGRAKKVEYEAKSELLYLIGEAVLIQGESSVKSDRITYDRINAVAKAGRPAKGSGRVKTIIEPSK